MGASPSTGIISRRGVDHAQGSSAVADAGVLAVSIVWGSTYVVMQLIGKYLTVPELLAARFWCAILALIFIYHRNIRNITRPEARVGIIFGLILFVVLALETLGVQFTTATNAGFLITLSVVIVPVFERFIGRVKHRLPVYLCVVAAIIGCGMLTISSASKFVIAKGDYIIITAAVIRGFQFFLWGHSTKGRSLSILNVTFIQLGVVAVLGSIGSIILGFPAISNLSNIPPQTWMLTVYLGVIGTAFAFSIQLRASRLISSTRVALLLSTEPVFAAAFGWLFTGNQISIWQLTGGALILMAAIIGRTVEMRQAGQSV
jgi:drug/metabolite transporter (DMT)-like permease